MNIQSSVFILSSSIFRPDLIFDYLGTAANCNGSYNCTQDVLDECLSIEDSKLRREGGASPEGVDPLTTRPSNYSARHL